MPLISGTVKDMLADRLSKGICLTIGRAKELAKLEDWYIAESKGIQSNPKPELDLVQSNHLHANGTEVVTDQVNRQLGSIHL